MSKLEVIDDVIEILIKQAMKQIDEKEESDKLKKDQDYSVAV